MKILITSAGGQTGQKVVEYLHQTGQKHEIFAGVHEADKERQQKLLEKWNVKFISLEAKDQDRCIESFKNMDIVFIIPPATSDKVTLGKRMIQAASECNCKVLLLSMVKSDEQGYLFADQFHQLEEECKNKIKEWSIVRSNFYAQNLLLYRDQLMKGELPLPIENGKFAPVDVEDVAKASIQILLNFDHFKTKILQVTGPESLNGDQMAQVFSTCLGKPIKFKNISPKQAKDILLSQHVPPSEIQGLLDFYELVSENKADLVSKDYEQFKVPLTSLKDFATKHKSECMGQAA